MNPRVPAKGYKLKEYYEKNWGVPLAALQSDSNAMVAAAKAVGESFNWERRIVRAAPAHCLIEA